MKKSGMGSHESCNFIKTEWLTPRNIIEGLPVFDLDPCSPINRPWSTARNHFTIEDDGLVNEWYGRVFCNPPYDNSATWLQKMVNHGNGIVLIFARTETKLFFQHVWNKASAILFIEGRITFCHVTGEKASMNAGAPSVLIAYGDECAELLSKSNIPGKFIRLNP